MTLWTANDFALVLAAATPLVIGILRTLKGLSVVYRRKARIRRKSQPNRGETPG